MPVYVEVIKRLEDSGAYYIQLDEPCLSLNLTDAERAVFVQTYTALQKAFPQLHFIVASYFECYSENLQTALSLPIQTLHLDLVRCPLQLYDVLAAGVKQTTLNLSLGIIDGRNIWKNDFSNSLTFINKAIEALGADRILIAPSCSLLHVPCDLDLETNETDLPSEVKNWMAYARQSYMR